MKVWLVALNAFRGYLHSRAVLVFLLIFLFTLLGSAGSLYFAAQMEAVGAPAQAQALFARQIEDLLGTYTVFTFMLAVVAAATLLPGEMKSGTIVPTLGRALHRGEYLLGLYLALNLLLVCFLALAALSVLALAAWGGVGLSAYLLLGVFHLVLVANAVMALAFFFSTLLSPLVAILAALFMLSLPSLGDVVTLYSQPWGERIRTALEHLLPAWDLLDIGSYLVVTRSPAPREWTTHLTGVVHGLDYLAVVLLLAFLVFRRRSLLPPT